MAEATAYLLDSHILLWSLYEEAKLSTAQRAILESDARTFISAATIWEIEIKKKAGRLPLPDAIWEQAADVGHDFLSIEPAHARFAGALPAVHGDPFDRMLIAQATLNGLTILTVDEMIRAYPVATV